MAQAVDLVVDRSVLVDVGVCRLDVRLRLVVVVVGDKVLDSVVGEQVAKLLVQLCREGLVVGDDQRRLLDRLNDPRDGVRLTRPRDAEKRLLVDAARVAVNQRLDCVWLVAGGIEGGVDAELAVGGGPVGGKWPCVAHTADWGRAYFVVPTVWSDRRLRRDQHTFFGFTPIASNRST